MEWVGGCYRIDLGGDLNDEKNENIIHLGLRGTPINHFTHNNQIRVSRGGWKDVAEEAQPRWSVWGDVITPI